MQFARKKTSPIRKLSPIQEKRYYQIVFILIVLAVVWLILSPQSGLLALWKKRSELQDLQQQTVVLQEENDRLQKEIDRLENDPQYLEEIARREHNLLKKNERVFEFAPKASTREK